MLDPNLLPLRSSRAVLRPMRLDDARAYAEGTADPLVRKYAHLPEPEYTEASVSELIQGEVSKGLARGDLAVLAIGDPATDNFAGSLVLFDVTSDSAEVGFWVHPEHRGRGLASAALSNAIVFARHSGLTRLVARAAPENRASQRVLENAGFTRGAEVSDFAPSGKNVALIHYESGLLRDGLMPIGTERLRLRLHESDDSVWLHRIYSQEGVARYLLDEPWSLDDAARQVTERLTQTDLNGEAHALALVIEHDGIPIGSVLLWLVGADHRTAEIGWVMDPSFGGRGFAREAASAVLELAFDHYKLHRVCARMDARNRASARLAAALGMSQEAHLRQDWWSKGAWTDTLIFGMLASDR